MTPTAPESEKRGCGSLEHPSAPRTTRLATSAYSRSIREGSFEVDAQYRGINAHV